LPKSLGPLGFKPGSLAGLRQGTGHSPGRTLLCDSANHLQTLLGFASLWCSEGQEGERYSRAEGKGTADDNEKHDTYKSISDAAAPAPDRLFSTGVRGY
jgi:hypothetical protein